MKKAIITLKQEIDKFGSSIEVLESNYINFAQRHGLIPTVCSSLRNYSDEELLENDVFILTGGGMVGQKYILHTNKVFEQRQRDIFEDRLIALAVSQGKLLLGICRGMQLINCYFGGKISGYSYSDRPVKSDHIISLLGKDIAVNNYHNYCVYGKGLGTGLIAIGIDKKYDIIEAFINTKNNLLGLQWHPERAFENVFSQQETDALVSKFLKHEGFTV